MPASSLKWTEAELDSLFEAFDEIDEQNLYGTLKQAKQHIASRSPLRGFNDSDIQRKLVEMAKVASTTPAPLVKDWNKHKACVLKHYRQGAGSDSSRTPSKSPSKSPTQKSKRDKHRRQRRSRESQSPTRSQQSPHPSNPPRGEEELSEDDSVVPTVENSSEASTHDPEAILVLDAAPRTKNPLQLQEDFLWHWTTSGFNRKFTDRLIKGSPQPVFDSILRRVDEGVVSFCKAQPFAQLSFAKLTQGSFDLARTLVHGHERVAVEQELKSLLGDPLVEHATIPRSFGAAAITAWAFGNPYGTLPEDRPKHAQHSMSGRLLGFCEENMPRLVEALRKEDRLAYLEEVVQPTLPGLATQYQSDLFDVFNSLRVPPGPPEPWQYAITDTHNSQGRSREYRGWHLYDFKRSMEQAFLAALEFRLKLERIDKTRNGYAFEFPCVGDGFDGDSMTVASSAITDSDLTEENKVILCLFPGVNSGYNLDTHPSFACIQKALVVVEGYKNDPRPEYPIRTEKAPEDSTSP